MSPCKPELHWAGIHIWQVDLAGDPIPDTTSVLVDAELRRADKFAFERDRNRFLRGRYGLRSILGAYLDIAPRDLPIELNPHGKPLLGFGRQIGFNLSHSGDCGIVAVGRMAEIGIDIEILKLPAEPRCLARSVFSAQEAKVLDTIADNDLSVPFFTCWTRKEAYLKALGVGFGIEPRSVTVGVESGHCRVGIAGRCQEDFVEVATLFQNDRFVVSLAVVGGFSDANWFEFENPTMAERRS